MVKKLLQKKILMHQIGLISKPSNLSIFQSFNFLINLLFSVLCSLFINYSSAQNLNLGEIHGNFQTDVQFYNPDSAIGAAPVPQKMLENSFLNVVYTNGKFSAGLRYESYLNVMQGFDPRYKGNGLPYRFASFKNEKLEVTVGNFYEQFGTGMIFRTYENWGLGYDNSLEGIKIKLTPHKGITLKGVIGKQRYFFDYGDGIVRGADGEINLNETFVKLAEKKTQIILGGSFVSKYQADNDPIYILPENVGAMAGRLNIIRGKINFYSEYAYKINDPSTINSFIYKPGQSLLVQTSYSQKGLGITLAAKRIDNMSFKSDRTATGIFLDINYLSSLTRQQTYNLASMYSYATQANGEMGLMGEIMYKIKKDSKLGGKYGMLITFNYSRTNELNKTLLPDSTYMGYESNFFKVGKETYSQECNLEINKKFSSKVKATFAYLYQEYNKAVVQSAANVGIIYSHIGILDLSYKINDENTIRTELQHLYTKQDNGSWAMGLLEYTIAPNYFAAVSDLYNYGNENEDKRLHYYSISAGYMKDALRISLSYGRQRAGVFCVGGVCRNVPASNGLLVTITDSF